MNDTTHDTSIINRKILNIYWMIILITAAAGLTAFTIDGLVGGFGHIRLTLLMNYLVKPLTGMLLLVAVGEWIARKSSLLSDYVGVIVSNLLPVILVIFYTEVKGVQFSLLYGVITSALYYKRSKVIASSIFSAFSIFVLMAVYEPFRSQMDWLSVLFSVACIFCFAILANAIIEQGRNLKRDLQQSHKVQQKLIADTIEKDYITRKDALTQAYNRLAFDELMGELNSRGYIFTLAILDVDDFKRINDTYGHIVGDKVLKCIADCVLQSLPQNDYFFRYGGEEFAIVYFEKSLQETALLSEELRATLEDMRLPELEELRITISMGLAERKAGQSIEELKQEADQLLYQAKRTGKNQIQYEEIRTLQEKA